MKKAMNFQRFLKYFFRGLLFVVPAGLTVYVIFFMVQWADQLIPFKIPGLGLLTVVFVTAGIGAIANTIIAKPFFDLIGDIMKRIPIISFIYTSTNDLVTAFIGDKKKFDQAVLVPFDNHGILYKPGFITQSDLEKVGLPGKVTVYFPHSYNFSGNVFIVDSRRLTRLEGRSTEIMKYIVSAGVSGNFRVKNQDDLP